MNETEKRVWLTDEQYNELLIKLGFNSSRPERQVTIYYDAKGKDLRGKDLRLMQTVTKSKIWFKRGGMHDSCRDEQEVIFASKFYQQAEIILGEFFDVKAMWFRERYSIERYKNHKNAELCLDRTINYGSILELEFLTSENTEDTEKQRYSKLIDSYLDEFKLIATDKKFLDDKYESYIKTWKTKKNPNVSRWLKWEE